MGQEIRERKMMVSTNKRIFAKCLTYRMVSFCLSVFIAWVVFDNIQGALSVGFLDFFVKMGLQFGNEKIWKLTDYGKVSR
jgi:uncharacterized membrane protein